MHPAFECCLGCPPESIPQFQCTVQQAMGLSPTGAFCEKGRGSGRSEGGAKGSVRLLSLDGQQLPQARLLGLCICSPLLPRLGVPTNIAHPELALQPGDVS